MQIMQAVTVLYILILEQSFEFIFCTLFLSLVCNIFTPQIKGSNCGT